MAPRTVYAAFPASPGRTLPVCPITGRQTPCIVAYDARGAIVGTIWAGLRDDVERIAARWARTGGPFDAPARRRRPAR